MNAILPTAPDTIPAQSDSEEHIIVIALHPLPDAWNYSSMCIVQKLLIGALKSAGVEADGMAGLMVGDQRTLLSLVSVRERDRTLCAIRKTLEQSGMLGFSEVAYFDTAELFWRTFHPAGAEPFDRFLKPEDLPAALDRAQRETAEFIRRLRPPTDNPDNPS